MIKYIKTPLYLAFFAVLTLSTLQFSGCKKDKDPVLLGMSGTLVDPNTGAALSGVAVKLSSNELVNGVWSNTYNTLDQATTGSDGRFLFEFENRTAVDYRLNFEKTNYFLSEVTVNTEELSTASTYDASYDLYSKAWFEVRVLNVNPFDASDNVIYQQVAGTGNCGFCCDNDQHSYSGVSVDTTKKCSLYGSQWVKYDYFVYKDAQQFAFADSVFVTPGDTTFAVVSY
jgi:5-hydroxyisourate hydrolase-like protein (transthyretin family)